MHYRQIGLLPKKALGTSPYFIVYGMEVILPPNVFLPSLQLAQSIIKDGCPIMQNRLDTILKLKEEREKSRNKFHQYQQIIKCRFDKDYVNDK